MNHAASDHDIDHEGLARRLDRALESLAPIPPLSQAFGLTSIEDAYRVQTAWDAIRRAKGESIMGRKIGLTSQAVRDQFGVDEPDFGNLWSSRHVVLRDGRASVDTATFLQPRIEAEFAFLMGGSLPPGEVTAADVIALARDTGHSRFPITGAGIDDVVGVVHVKGALSVPREERDLTPVTAFMREASFVPDTQTADVLLGHLRGGGQLAVVLDEYGGTAGVVTLEDLVEELVGEVADEHDRREAAVRQWPDDSWTLPGMLRLDEVAERVGLVIPEDEDYDTLGGFVMAELGKVPERGDVVEVDGGRLIVLRMDGLRVDRLRYVPRPPAPAVGEAPA